MLTTTELAHRRRRLSAYQHDTLQWLASAYRANEDAIAGHTFPGREAGWMVPALTPEEQRPWAYRNLECGGIRFPRSDDVSRSESASMSRSLKRLEDLGLIRRMNRISGPPSEGFVVQHRTTHIALTPEGRQLAEALTPQTPKDASGRA